MWLIMSCERQADYKLLNIFINTSEVENVAEGHLVTRDPVHKHLLPLVTKLKQYENKCSVNDFCLRLGYRERSTQMF